MGFGCNEPAVISTQACSSCSRGTCISAIAFGAACSYQLGATLGVFAAAGLPYLILPYLLFLSATTLVYVRLTAPREAR
jgi:ferrous iron transport protein B